MSREIKPAFSITRNDFRFDFFRCGGKGGQKQNKTSSGARCTHIETGISAESREERSQAQNKKIAFQRCAQKLIESKWFKVQKIKANGRYAEIERAVEEAMRPENMKVEYYDPA